MKIWVKRLLVVYILFLIIGGILIYSFYKPREPENNKTPNLSDENGKNVDKAGLVDGSRYSGLIRLNMIESAETSLDISYYTIHAGKSTDIFFNSILEAADRGVQVRFLVDGIFNNMKRSGLKGSIYLMENHPNIELKFYEPISLTKPWTLNNRLHDKTIIVDNKLALIGGRNIGDKYFVEDKDETGDEPVRDRDVLIYNKNNREDSIIYTMKEYYNYVWNHEYSVNPAGKKTRRKEVLGEDFKSKIKRTVRDMKKIDPEIFTESYIWDEITIDVESIEFVHNPIERMNKRPWAMRKLFSIMDQAEESIFVQSPYIIPSKEMRDEFTKFDIDTSIIEVLTNSYYSTPNFPAISGYYNHREEIVDTGAKINEYQGEDSIHAKTYIIDKELSVLGSVNLDPRSGYLSTESFVIIRDKEFAKELRETIDEYMDESLEVGSDYKYIERDDLKAKKVSKFKMLLIKIISKIVYFFEYML